jgi:hypothetical protein
LGTPLTPPLGDHAQGPRWGPCMREAVWGTPLMGPRFEDSDWGKPLGGHTLGAPLV